MHIHSRKSWGARSPRPGRGSQNPRNVREFFVHWPGEGVGSYADIRTPAQEAAIMRGFQNFHMDGRGWNDFAYSFAIFPSGRVYRGRGMTIVPASQLNHNTNTMSVCCVFGERETTVPKAMADSLRELHRWAEHKAGHSLTARPHRAVTQTQCPGDHLAALANRI